VNTINAQTGIDMLVIAGDFTFLPGNKNLEILFSPLKLSNVPIYAVLGNHDEQKPGPNLKRSLVRALENNGVKYLENDAVDLIDMILIGLGDRDAGNDDTRMIDRFATDNNVVVITHNPDTTHTFTNTIVDVTLAGHTHC
jgi:predicted MPP superfamily phosphohydrolase